MATTEERLAVLEIKVSNLESGQVHIEALIQNMVTELRTVNDRLLVDQAKRGLVAGIAKFFWHLVTLVIGGGATYLATHWNGR